MFILYAADLEDVAAKHSVNIHSYTDDTQLYLHGHRDDMTSTVHRLENCITDVGQRMSANQLKLNTEKNELLWAGSRRGQSSVTVCRPSLQLGADTVTEQDTNSVFSSREIPEAVIIRQEEPYGAHLSRSIVAAGSDLKI